MLLIELWAVFPSCPTLGGARQRGRRTWKVGDKDEMLVGLG